MVINSSRVSANLVKHRARARYFTDADGVRRLHSIQFMNTPVFRVEGWEERGKDAKQSCPLDEGEKKRGEEITTPSAKARRRAQKEIFELALCNPDLDAFVTLTFSPEAVKDRGSYDDVYKEVKTWFSNRVQRKGLKYILVPERHKNGGLHFHGFANSNALRLIEARYQNTGRLVVKQGRQVYNVEDWSRLGFSTCKLLPKQVDDRLRAAKYCTKYISKDAEKIGGRYFLHGGELCRWEYEYGEAPSELTDAQPRDFWYSEGDGYAYTEYTYM